MIQEFNLQEGGVVLRVGTHVEADAQFARGGNLAFHAGIVEGVAVAQHQLVVLQRNIGVDGGINVPGSQLRQRVGTTELQTVGMVVGVGLHGNGNVADPHVLLVHGVSHPQVAVGRRAVALQDAASVLRSTALIVAAVAHGWYFAVDQRQRGVVKSVARERDAEWPAELGGIVNGGVGAVAEPLPPYLGVAVHEATGAVHWLCPRQSAVGADAGERVLPQGHDGLAVGQRVVAIGLVVLVQRNQRVFAVAFLHPLHAEARVLQQFVAGTAHVLRSLGVVRIGGLVLFVVEIRLVGVVVIDEVDGP